MLSNGKSILSLPGCKECPNCNNNTLRIIPIGSAATATCCYACGTIVNKSGAVEGKIE